ncbi:MAG: 50S ribosomal protein L9 [Bacteriovoracaceae bacterium]|nr:50S ribosomal protein L9 [Bacteriovoracaceae bacterium]
MKVILIEKVPSLGSVGEIINVSSGYGRNYLIPNKLGVLASEANQAELDNQKRALQKKMAEERSAAEGLKKKIDGLVLEFTRRVGGNGKLFGTVTNNELAKELGGRGVEVERRILTVDSPIKSIGEFNVKAKLFTDVIADFKVKVIMDPKQADEEKEKQASAAKRKAAKAAEAKLKEAEADVEAEKAKEVENAESTDAEIAAFEQE